MKKLSIVIPVYNEEQTIEALLDRVYATKLTITREIIIVNDGSKDSSPELIHNWMEKHPVNAEISTLLFHQENGGKGAAVRTGIKNSTGDIVIIQDADLEYDPDDYQKCIEPILAGYAKVVYGSREKLSENRLHSSLPFYVGGLAITYWMNLLFGSSLTDEPTCYKTFDGSLIRTLLFEGAGFEWEPEITAKLLRLGYYIHEVPVSYYPRKITEGKKITWKDGIIAFYISFCWRIRSVKKERNKLCSLDSESPRFQKERQERNYLFLIVLIACLLRFFLILPGFSDPETSFFRPDSPTYVEPAFSLLETGNYNIGPDDPTPATLRPPGYAFFLAFLFALGQKSLIFPVFIFCILSALCCIPIFKTGKYFGNSTIGFIAVILYSFNITSIAAAPMYLSDTLFLFIVSWQLFWFTRFYFEERLIDLWFTVICSGLATLIRPVGLFWIVPCLFLALIFNKKSIGKRLLGIVGCIVLYLAILSPWMLRNHLVDAGFVLNTNIGRTLYYHNCAAMMSIVSGESADSIRQHWMKKEEEIFKENQQKYATEKARNKYRIDQAKIYLKKHFLLYVCLHFQPAILVPDAPTFFEILGFTETGRGTLDVLNRKGLVAAVKHYFQGKLWLLVIILPLLAIVLVTYLGCCWQLFHWLLQKQIFLFFFFLAFVVYYLILPGPIAMPRYQLPALPLITVMAGISLHSCFKKKELVPLNTNATS